MKQPTSEHVWDHHFGDPTAHVTVEWFLAQLSSASRKSGEELLEPFTEEKSTLCEALYKSLTAVRFTDCLREQIKDRKDLFPTIERIAEAFEKTEKWKDFPNLTVLFLSIAREHLANDTKLYSVGKDLYAYFKELSRRLLPFNIGLEFKTDLNNGKISEDLRRKFETHKCSLSPNAMALSFRTSRRVARGLKLWPLCFWNFLFLFRVRKR